MAGYRGTAAWARGRRQAAVATQLGIDELTDVLNAQLDRPEKDRDAVKVGGARAAIERLGAAQRQGDR